MTLSHAFLLAAGLVLRSSSASAEDDESCAAGKIRQYQDECVEGTGDVLFLLDASKEARGTFPKQLVSICSHHAHAHLKQPSRRSRLANNQHQRAKTFSMCAKHIICSTDIYILLVLMGICFI